MKKKKVSVKEIIDKEGFIIYPIKGTSMLPLLREGIDQVHLVKTDEYNLFDVVLFQSAKNSYILHRIIGIKDDKYAIIGDNSFRVDYKSKDELIAKMQGFYQKDVYIDVKDESYINYMNKYILSKQNECSSLIENPEEYFFNRFKKATYEVYKYGYDNSYVFNPELINKLTVSEKRKFVSLICEKKAGHMLGGMISKNPNFDLSEKAKKYLINEYEISKLRYIRIEEAKSEISRLLGEAQIKHIFLKGSEIRSLYKTPNMRWSNDIDFYVNPNDLDKVTEILKDKMNCTYYAESIQHRVFENEQFKLHFELHGIINAFFPKDLLYLLDDPFIDAIEDESHPYSYHLSPTRYYLHHLAHMVSHTASGEFWSHMYLDTYIMTHNKEINYCLIKEARLDVFSDAIRHISNYVLDDSIILTDAEKAFERILFRDDKEISAVVNKGKKDSSFGFIMRRLFPKYKSMKYMYPVLKKAPVLLPFFYIVRILSFLFTKGKIKKGIVQVNSFNKAQEDEVATFENVGLKEYLNCKLDV